MGILEGATLGKSVGGGLVAYDARLPSGLEPPAVLHRGVERGGGSNRRGERQVGEKAHKTHLVCRGIGVGLRITAARSLAGDSR